MSFQDVPNIIAPMDGPRWPQNSRKMAQDGPKWLAEDGPKLSQDATKMTQDGPTWPREFRVHGWRCIMKSLGAL